MDLIKIQKKSMFEIRKTFFRKQNFVSEMDRLGHMGALSRMTPSAYRSGPSGADTERAPNALRRAKSGMARKKSSGIIFISILNIKISTDILLIVILQRWTYYMFYSGYSRILFEMLNKHPCLQCWYINFKHILCGFINEPCVFALLYFKKLIRTRHHT